MPAINNSPTPDGGILMASSVTDRLSVFDRFRVEPAPHRELIEDAADCRPAGSVDLRCTDHRLAHSGRDPQ
jgi:hypothetical protein